MKTVSKEDYTSNRCNDNPEWLEHGHIKRALLVHAPYMNTATNCTPKNCLLMHQMSKSVRSLKPFRVMHMYKIQVWYVLTDRKMRRSSMLSSNFQALRFLSATKATIALWIVPIEVYKAAMVIGSGYCLTVPT